jgi:hypothetical protein
MRVTGIAYFACAVAAGVLSACASGGGTPGGVNVMAGDAPAIAAPMSIVIVNSTPGAGTMTAYMMPEVGVDRALGTVEAGREATFAFDGEPGRYRIRLVGARGEIVSDIFRLSDNSEGRWDVSLGARVRVSGR